MHCDTTSINQYKIFLLILIFSLNAIQSVFHIKSKLIDDWFLGVTKKIYLLHNEI